MFKRRINSEENESDEIKYGLLMTEREQIWLHEGGPERPKVVLYDKEYARRLRMKNIIRMDDKK